jgi:Resolvase, N terminal domain
LRISDALGAANGVRCIIVESPDRFARDLTVQLAGHDFLKKLGISLVPATAPDFFTEDTPTAVLVRQVLGAIAQFEKTSLVAKLKASRDRKKAATGKCEGRKSYAEAKPETVALAKELHGQCMSLRRIAAELAARGHLTAYGKPYVASAVQHGRVERVMAPSTPAGTVPSALRLVAEEGGTLCGLLFPRAVIFDTHAMAVCPRPSLRTSAPNRLPSAVEHKLQRRGRARSDDRAEKPVCVQRDVAVAIAGC